MCLLNKFICENLHVEYVRRVHKELKKSYLTYQAAQRYGGVPKQQKKTKRHRSNVNSEIESKAETSQAVETAVESFENTDEPIVGSCSSLQKMIASKDKIDNEVIGCMPVGFNFNESNGYKKVSIFRFFLI